MTTRVFVTLLMLAQVMACPFLDCGECRGACAVASAESDSVCDNCCESESAVCAHETDPCDDPVCPDNPGPLDCLCGGAVQAAAVVCPDLLAGGEFLTLPEAALTHSPLVVAAASNELAVEGCPHFPPLISGTLVCALTQTYLL